MSSNLILSQLPTAAQFCITATSPQVHQPCKLIPIEQPHLALCHHKSTLKIHVTPSGSVERLQFTAQVAAVEENR